MALRISRTVGLLGDRRALARKLIEVLAGDPSGGIGGEWVDFMRAPGELAAPR